MRVRTLETTLIIALAMSLGACSNRPPEGRTVAWPMYQMNPDHNAVTAPGFPAVRWTQSLQGKNNAGFAYDGTRLFADDFADNLLALDPRSGRVIWRARGDDVLMSTPVVAQGLVFVGSGTGKVMWDRPGNARWGRPQGNHWYAFRASDGVLQWALPVAGEGMPSAAYANGRVIFATGDNLAHAVDARTGRVLWTTPLPGVPTMASAAVDGPLVFLAVTQGKAEWKSPSRSHTLALDQRTGAVRWSSPYGNGDCAPTVADGLVFVETAHDGPPGAREAFGTNDVVALDERTGALRWKYRGPPGFFSSVGSKERAIAGTYAGGVLYQSTPATSEILAFSARDGRILWRTRTSGPAKMSPVVDRGNVYVGDSSGILYRIDAKTGTVEGTTLYGKPFTTAPPLILGGTIFFTATDTIRALPLQGL